MSCNLCVWTSLSVKELNDVVVVDEDDIKSLFEKYENANAVIAMFKKKKKKK